MSYRRQFYSKYITRHTKHLYGGITLSRIENQFRFWNSYFTRFLPSDPNANILDVGCGEGGFVHWLNKNGFKNVTGIDISDEQVAAARTLGIRNIIQADALQFLRDKRHVYDVVFARDILEHFSKEEAVEVLSLIFRALKMGGMFVGQTANMENLFRNRVRWGDFTHELAFTKESISQLLRATNFVDVRVFSQPPVVHGVRSFVRFILWKCFEWMLRFYFLVEAGARGGIFTSNIIVMGKKLPDTEERD